MGCIFLVLILVSSKIVSCHNKAHNFLRMILQSLCKEPLYFPVIQQWSLTLTPVSK